MQGRHLFEKRFSSPHPIFQKLLYAIRPGLLRNPVKSPSSFVNRCVRKVILQGRHLFEKRFSSPHPIFQKLLYAIRPGLLSQSGQIAIKFCKKGMRRENFWWKEGNHSGRRYLSLSAGVNFRMTRHGFPAANTPDGMFFVTTLPAPMTVPSPMVTPGRTTVCPPIQTLFPI